MQDLGGGAKGAYVRHVVLPPCYHATARRTNGTSPITMLTFDCWRVEIVEFVRRNVEKEMGLTPVYVNYMPRHETHTLMPTFKAVNDQDEDHLYAA